jgi:N-methylhydantoinase A
VCYLHSYVNPRHEEETAALVRRTLQDAYVSISSEVLPQIKEYERVSTTVVNAYVGPILGRYLERLEKRMRDAGYAGSIVVMQSHGGVAGIPDAIRLAAGSVLSGPAGGIAGAVRCGAIAASPRLITFDMGGTSTDIALVSDGAAHLTADQSLAGQRIALPSIDIHTLGAGGGSIAHVDAGGMLHVGPRSAGAHPGPACYGRGGGSATVTDANLVLGYLDPDNFLGGRAALDAEAAARAVDAIAAELGSTRVEAAHGICRIVDTSMAEGISVVSVRRGIDPRGFALLAFGGAAGLHATSVARMLEIPRVIVPRVASVLSAWGMLAGDLRWDLVRTCFAPANQDIGTLLAPAFAAIEAEGARRAGAGDAIRFSRSADMRLGEQVYEITVDLDGLSFTDAQFPARLRERFHRRHQELYGYSSPAREPMVVNLRLAVTGGLAAPPVEPVVAHAGTPEARTVRRTWQGRWVETFVFDLDRLPADAVIEGPALFESATTTVLIRAGERARVTAHGWLDIDLTARAPT